MEELSTSRRLVIFVGIILSILLFALDNMIITPALPRILSDIGGVSHINWVFTAYLLTSTIITPIYGKLTDIFSRKKMFLLAIFFFVFASMLCGQSNTIYELIFFRGLQGLGGGAIMVTAISMIGEIFSIRERAKYQGFIGGVFAVASILGPVVGGYITETFSWRWTFYINAPLGVLAFLIIYMYVPKILPQSKGSRIDYFGSLFLVLFLVPLILIFSSISQSGIFTKESLFFCVASIVAFIFFYKTEKKFSSPIFSHHLFFDRYFVIPAIMTFTNAIILFAATLYIQLYAQKVMRISIQESGLLLAAIMIPITLSSLVYGYIVAHTGRYKKIVVFGASVLFISIAHFTYILHTLPTKETFILSLVPIGIGFGAMMSVFNMIITMVYPRERLGEVTGALQLVRGVGGTFGTALLGMIFGLYVTDINGNSSYIMHATVVIFGMLSIFSLLSLVVSLYMKDKKV
jgi:EmrB/QacA subfamily drug resistance transporter